MRNQIYRFLVSPPAVIVVLLVSTTLTYQTGGLGYVFGMVVALLAFWGSGFKWLSFGISRPEWRKTIQQALLLTLGMFLLMDVLIQPMIESMFGVIDLSELDGIRGNFISYLLLIIFMWIAAAFGEEFLYRGFFMKQLARILGDTDKAWLISAVAVSALFGVAHLYQGMSGVITTGLAGFLLAMIFYKNRENLVLAMLVHGFYDVIGITLIYLNKERIIIEWIQAL